MKTLVAIVILTCALSAQEQPLRWSGELRFRSEADGRDFNLSTAPNLYTLSRIRLGADVRPLPNVGITLKVQDSRRFGEEASTTANHKNLDLYEGYAVIDSFLHPTVSLKLGRMALSCGSDRIIGNLAWSNVGRAFDGVLVHYAQGDAVLDFFAVNIADLSVPPDPVNAANTAFRRDNGTMMTGGYYTNPFGGGVIFNAYGIAESNKNRSVPEKDDLMRYTAGSHIKGSADGLLVDVEAAYQFGEEKGKDVAAYMAAVSVGYSVNGELWKNVSANVDIISGTRHSSTAMNTFVPPYPTGHKFYGFMDYFISMPVQTFNRGLIDAYLRSSWKLSGELQTTVTLHHFITEQQFSATNDARDLGQELDIISSYRYTKNVSFEAGVTSFIPNALMRSAFGASDIAYWGYLTTTIGF